MKYAGRGRKTWYECVKDDMKVLDLHSLMGSVQGYVEGLHLGRNV